MILSKAGKMRQRDYLQQYNLSRISDQSEYSLTKLDQDMAKFDAVYQGLLKSEYRAKYQKELRTRRSNSG
jgi:hypothetical protein